MDATTGITPRDKVDNNTNNRVPVALLMEDEPLARWVERKALEEAGLMVIEAADCAEARSWIDRQRFDVLVFDYRLPDGNGLDVLSHVRARGRSDPAFMLTAEADEITPDAVRDLAVCAVLDKPVDVEALQGAVAGVLRDESVPAGGAAAWVDRFRVVRLPGEGQGDAIAGLHPTAEDRGWLALDCREVEPFQEHACAQLVDLAMRCRAAGGRLAVMGVRCGTSVPWRETVARREFDVVVDERMLEALSRRLTSNCERQSLLEATVLRAGEPSEEGAT